MVTRIVHCGANECHRIQVLKHLGYLVIECESVVQLLGVMLKLPETDAVIVEENDRELPLAALSVIRSSTQARFILFKKTHWQEIPGESMFDLVIPDVALAESWTVKVAVLIAGSLRGESNHGKSTHRIQKESCKTRSPGVTVL